MPSSRKGFISTKTSSYVCSSDGVYINQAQFQDYYADVNATLPLEKEEYFVDVIIYSHDNMTNLDSLLSRLGVLLPASTMSPRKESLT